jgi:hypothetical protein
LDPEVFSDSDYAGNEDMQKLTMGCVIMLNGGVVIWQLRRQSTVALSTTEVEHMALIEVAKEVT